MIFLAADPAIAIGPLAGLLTSVLWTLTSIFFTAAGRRIGPSVVNATRLVLAVILLGLIYRFVVSDGGAWWPSLSWQQMTLLAVSGVIGLAIGDQALFTAFVDIGPRVANLLMTTAPVIAALSGWLVLGETLEPMAMLGIGLTMFGVAWVVLDRTPETTAARSPHRVRGVILALVGAACQAVGLMLSKAGMGHGWMAEEEHLDPQAATFVRMTVAAIAVMPLILVWRRYDNAKLVPRIGTKRGGAMFVLAGTIFGPVLGVWMSLVAADATSVGIAQTLLSLTPILILPYAAIVERERLGVRAIAGAVCAVAGVAILFI